MKDITRAFGEEDICEMASREGYRYRPSDVIWKHWRNRLLESKEVLDFHEIVQKFREYRTESPERRSLSHGAFPTFQGKGINSIDYKECLCGEIHHFKSCPYLIEEKRTPGWKSDLKVEQKINEKLCANARLKGIINQLHQEAKDGQEKDVTPAETSKGITKDVMDENKDSPGVF